MKKLLALGVSLILALVLSVISFAAVGDMVADVIIGEGEDIGIGGPNDGVGVAFDGTYLYYSAGFSDPILHRVDTTGGDHLDIAVTDSISGLPVVVQAMAYDAGRDRIWTANGDDIYLVDKTTGVAEFKFDTGVLCGLDDGLAYDASDDSIWWSCDGSTTVYHYQSDGTPIGSFALAGQMVPECGFDYSSGIAVGGDILYLGADGCDFYFTFHKNGTKIASYPYTALRSEDLECDPLTFAPTEVMWIRDAYDGHIRAFEIPAGTCGLGGEPPGICPETETDTMTLQTNRWMFDGTDWITKLPKGVGPQRSYTIEDTQGCSCEQILDWLHENYPDEFGEMEGQYKYGCSISIMDRFIELTEEP